MLAALGHEVVTASNGLEGVGIFRSDPQRIDVVVTDLRMPVMDGYEAIRCIRDVSPNARIVSMSGCSPEGRPSGTVFLPKPFTLEMVRDCVDRASRARPCAPTMAA